MERGVTPVFEALWSSPSPTLGWHCLTLWCSEGTWHPKNSWGGDFGCFNRPLWCSVGIWHPKNLWGEDFGCFNRPCSPLQPHFWGSVWPPNLQPHLSLLLGLSFCCLLPLKPWGSLLWPHSLCPWALCWMVGSFSSCQGQGGAAVPVSGVQLLPGEGCVKVLLCTVGLSDVLPHSWGFFLFLKKNILKFISEVQPGSGGAAQESQDSVSLQQLKVGVTGVTALGRCGAAGGVSK